MVIRNKFEEVWNDQKCKVRHKLVVINASRQATGGGPSNAPDLSPLEEKVANIIGRDVGPMPHVRQDQFAGDSNVLEEMEETVEEMMEAVEEVAELPPFPGSNPENSVPTVMNIPYEDQPPSPVPSISGQAPRPIRVRGRRRRAERVVHYPATNHMQASQATTNRSALDESRSMLLKIEEMRAEAALNNSRAMVNVSESLRIIADSIDRMSRQDFNETPESEKPTSDEYAVAKWLKSNVPTKKTKFLNHHVEYFTGTKAVDALLTSKWATGKSPLFTTRHEVTDFLHSMLLHKLFHRAKKVPVSEQELKGKSKKKDAEKNSKSGDEKDGDKSQASACEGKDTKDKDNKEKEKKKRKIRLEMHMEQLFLDTADAYVWLYDPMPWYYWLCGALVVLGTVAVCMFPLWPATVRKGVYYLSIAAAAFLVLIIALAILRVVVFCLVWALTLSRHHLWLLPNLTEDVGFFASFWPLYKYEYRGPGADGDKSSKKKKKKKDKLSDDEEDKKEREEKKPLLKEEVKVEEPSAVVEEALDSNSREDPPTPNNEKHSESESENSQRSSTDRDFEMVDPGDLEPDPDSGER